MGKKPFSAKAKREQLRRKRNASNKSNSPQSHTSSPGSTSSSVRGGRPNRGSNPQGKYRLMFAEDSEAARKRNRAQAHVALTQPSAIDYNKRRMDVDSVRPHPDVRFSMPKRPAWSYKDTLNIVNKRETAMFASWLEQVSRPEDPLAAYFEGNLETWRQLWRVIERSDVLVLVADIRFPALHFVPDLYHYVTEELGKGMVLALNKCDLVPADVLMAWKRYFEQRYDGLAVAMFSSFPDAKLAPSDANGELLSRRERRMARSKLSAWGADQLLAAVETLNLEKRKKAYLDEWRRKLDIAEETEYDDEDDDDQFVQQIIGSEALRARNDLQEIENESELHSKNKDSHQSSTQPNQGKAAKRRRRRSRQLDVETNSDLSMKGGAKKGKRFEQLEHPLKPAQNVNWQDPDDSSDSQAYGKMEGHDMDNEGVRENMITIGILGHPNAGKSSMINGVFRKKVVSTSRTPGHTKHLQTIYLSESVRLCDCPGLVFPGNAPRELQILSGMYPIAQVREPYAAIKYLAERVPLIDILKLHVEIPRLEEEHEEPGYISSKGWTAWKICEAWAIKRGFRTAKAARLDVFRAANNILRLALDGRIVLATVPDDFTSVSGQISKTSQDVTWDLQNDADANAVRASGRIAAVLSGACMEEGGHLSDDENSEDSLESPMEHSGLRTGNAFMLLEESE